MRLATALTFSVAIGLPASAAELIRCPDAASLLAVAAPASATPKADFASLVAPGTASPGASSSAAPALVSTAPLDPIGILPGAGGTVRSPESATATSSPSVGSPPSSCAYVIQSGDTLGRIAAAQIGSASRWSDIQAANPGLNTNALVPGRQIALPCAGGAVSAAAAPVAAAAAQAAPARTLVAPLKSGGEAKAAVAPAALAAPAPVILPTWTARSGEFFSDVVKRWAKKEGYSVVFATTADWKLAVAVSEQGSFEDVLDRLAQGLGANGRAPFIQLFPNKVIKIGGGA